MDGPLFDMAQYRRDRVEVIEAGSARDMGVCATVRQGHRVSIRGHRPELPFAQSLGIRGPRADGCVGAHRGPASQDPERQEAGRPRSPFHHVHAWNKAGVQGIPILSAGPGGPNWRREPPGRPSRPEVPAAAVVQKLGRLREKSTVRTTRGTDGRLLVVLARPDDHVFMITIFLACKAWVLKHGFTLA